MPPQRVLEAGDAYYFSSAVPHRFRNAGREECEIISASSPPTFCDGLRCRYLKPPHTPDWHALAAAIRPRAQAFINGRYLDAVSGETFDCLSPIDGRRLAKVAATDSADVDAAVAAARSAFNKGSWSRMAPAPQTRAAQVRRVDPETPGRARAARNARHGQTDCATAPASIYRRRRAASLVRRGDRQDLRRSGAHGARCARVGDARAGRRGRRDRALEFPAAYGLLEARACAGRR